MSSLTNEERARIFAMYMPCYVEIDGRHTKIVSVCFQHYQDEPKYEYEDVIVETDEDGHETGGRWATTDFQYFKNQVPKLQLTPLSKITDEHAIEVARIWKPDYEWKVMSRDQFDCLLMVECSDYIMWFDFMDSSFDFEEKYTGEENIEAHRCEKERTYCESIVEIIDRLRELGYALPYKGQSLFDLGIAIDKTTL